MVHLEVLLDRIFDLFPVPAVGGDHGVVLEIGDHGSEDAPTFDLFTDSGKGVALPVCNFDGLKAGPHFLYLVLHLSQIHLRPLELEIVVEPVLAFLYVLPQLLHPPHLYLDGLDDLLPTRCFALLEFEHFLIVYELS